MGYESITDTSGDITGVTAGVGLSGGGTSDAVTLNFGPTTRETISVLDGDTDLVPELQLLGEATADSALLLATFSTTATDAAAPLVAFAKGGNATIGSHTIVTDDEILGNIVAFGDNGTDIESPAASIQFAVDGTPSVAGSDATDMPGRIVFKTSPDGSDTLTERLRIDATGKVGIGIAGPDSNLHVQNATAGSVAAVANTVLTVENNTHAYLSILTPNDTVGGIVFGDVASNVAGRLLYTHDPASPQGFQFYVEGAERMRIDNAGSVYIGATSNANMTSGLTINQGATTNWILGLKNDMTAGTATNGTAMETNDYLTVGELQGAGGARINVKATDSATQNVIQISSIGGTATTTKSTSGRALEEHWFFETDGNALDNVTSNGNVFGMIVRTGGGNNTRWLLDAEGDTWQSGGATLDGDLTFTGAQSITTTAGYLTLNPSDRVSITAGKRLLMGSSHIASTSVNVAQSEGAKAVGSTAWGSAYSMAFVSIVRMDTAYDRSIVQVAYAGSSCTELTHTGTAHNVTFTASSGQLFCTANVAGQHFDLDVFEFAPG